MRICHINTNDITGGAARAAYRLHVGLTHIGHNSKLFVVDKQSNDPNVTIYTHPSASSNLHSRIEDRIKNGLFRLSRSFAAEPKKLQTLSDYQYTRPKGYEAFNDPRVAKGIAVPKQMPVSDVINLHWIANFVDYASFFSQIPRCVPIVWTLHDMNAFTGGCHYNADCEQYEKRCGCCPQLGSTVENDLSRQIWLYKQVVFRGVDPSKFHIIAPSQWLAKAAQRSELFSKFPISTIPYGLDTDIFSPRDKQLARQALEVPTDAKVVLFAAQSVTNRRKGFNLLLQALNSLHSVSDLFLVSIGSGQPQIYSDLPHLHLGNIANDRLLSLVYSAADVFVVPSLQDNLPNTILESLACGVPVVGFNVGGIPDMVRPGITGLLAPVGDVETLRNIITLILTDAGKLNEMSAHCRRIAVEEYALDIQAKRYISLYEKMLKKSHV